MPVPAGPQFGTAAVIFGFSVVRVQRFAVAAVPDLPPGGTRCCVVMSDSAIEAGAEFPDPEQVDKCGSAPPLEHIKNPRQLSPTGVFIFIKLRAWQ